MVPPGGIEARAGCERNVEYDFLAGEIVRPRLSLPTQRARNPTFTLIPGMNSELCEECPGYVTLSLPSGKKEKNP